MPPLIFPGGSGTGTGTGTTLKDAWRAIADELGEWAPLTVADEAALAVHPDADRQILCTGLEADQKDPGRFDGFWAYVVDGDHAGETRMVLSTTFDGPFGSLLLDRRFVDANGTSDPLAENTQVDLTSPLPVGRHLTVKGIKDCILEALRLITIETRLALTGTGSRSISLADYPYIALGDQVDSIWQRVNASEPYLLGANEATVTTDGADLALVTDEAVPSGEAFQLRVLRKADTLVKTAGTWGVSTTGPVNASDEVAVPLHWIKAFGMTKALRACITLTSRRRDIEVAERREMISDYERRISTWAGAAKRIILHEFPRPTPRRMSGLVAGVAVDTSLPTPLFGGDRP